ncbi:17211_t:CDS:10 [Funneliformis geosporum]|uniref:17211_t:CDS:1 n=1 Tax=Funneliformis geosporum TaxID=1117311 RepID=A0A9W4T097_9GLOM|nr:17211_t:CDS:10 [Funneliformis geosporum]
MSEEYKDIRVVLAIDFGTTYSGYAYAHVSSPDKITVKDNWDGIDGRFKIPTVLKYKDDSYESIESWGNSALAHKPFLPDNLDYKKVITDYMKKLCESIKETLPTTWPVVDLNSNWDLHSNVSIVLTVPAEFVDNEIKIMRECAFNAGLLAEKFSNNLRFTTEPEAAAIHCLHSIVKEQNNLKPGDSFMVVDCGGGTVDITTRELLEDNKLSERTVRGGDFCGSTFVDQKFLEFIGEMTGPFAIEQMKENHYAQLQYIVQEFCRYAKFKFTGEESVFEPYELDLDEIPVIKQYIKGEEEETLESLEWFFEIGFEDIKGMFDPVIERIINLIKGQLDQIENVCSAMFLVGGFTVLYGLNESTVATRKLPQTYGTDIVRKWQPSDPFSPNGYVLAFETLKKLGDSVPENYKIIKHFQPFSLLQRKISFNMYATKKENAKYCNDNGVTLLREWEIELPENENLDDVTIVFTLTFGVEITATAPQYWSIELSRGLEVRLFDAKLNSNIILKLTKPFVRQKLTIM